MLSPRNRNASLYYAVVKRLKTRAALLSSHRVVFLRLSRRREGRGGVGGVDLKGRQSGGRESLVIYISIPSTARAVRQPVCPNKQPAEGGMPHYYLPPPFFIPYPSSHSIQPRLRLLLRPPLELELSIARAVRCRMRTLQRETASRESRVESVAPRVRRPRVFPP